MSLIKNPFMRIWQTAFMVKSIEPVTAIALAQGAGKIASVILGRRRRSRANRQLTRIAEEGVLNQAAQRGALAETAAVTGNIAQIRTAQTRGRLAAANLTGSQAGERALEQPGIQQQESIAAAQRQITQFNQQSQREARFALAQQEGQIEEANRLESAQFRGQLAGDIAGAIAGFVEGRAIDAESAKQLTQLASAEQLSQFNILLGVLESGIGGVEEEQARTRLAELLESIVGIQREIQ
jgi:hypothetical protein